MLTTLPRTAGAFWPFAVREEFAPDLVRQHGLVVGIVQARAERYKVTNLGALPGGSDRSVPHGINNAGQVVGESGDPSFLQGFLWENGTMTPLGFLSLGGPQTVAEGINDAGQVVGSSGGIGVPTLAFIWDRINGMQSLGGGRLGTAVFRVLHRA